MANYKKIFTIFLLGILLIFPLFSFSQGCRELEVPIPGLTTNCIPAIPDYISAIYNFALQIIGIICLGALIYGGFRYLTSVGKPAAIGDAKDQIFSAILGLVILFSAYLILRTINPELVILSQPGTQQCGPGASCPGGQVCVAGICVSSVTSTAQCKPKTDPSGCPPNQECDENGNCITHFESWGGYCSGYLTPDTCPSDKCQWCPVCKGTWINNFGGDRCFDPKKEKCDYQCEVEKCGAKSCK